MSCTASGGKYAALDECLFGSADLSSLCLHSSRDCGEGDCQGRAQAARMKPEEKVLLFALGVVAFVALWRRLFKDGN